MKRIEKIAYQYKVLKLNNTRISHWIATEQYDRLVFASKKGNYKIRLKLITLLQPLLDHNEALHIIICLTDDLVQIISENALNVLKNFVSKTNTDLLKKIKDKEAYWIEKERALSENISTFKNKQTWKENKEAMVRLKQIKKQIKKSMYGERWM